MCGAERSGGGRQTQNHFLHMPPPRASSFSAAVPRARFSAAATVASVNRAAAACRPGSGSRPRSVCGLSKEFPPLPAFLPSFRPSSLRSPFLGWSRHADDRHILSYIHRARTIAATDESTAAEQLARPPRRPKTESWVGRKGE